MENLTGFNENIFEVSQIRLVFAAVAFIIGVVSITLNILAVIAISHIRGSLPVNIRLVCCLVAFDLLISIAVISDSSFSFHYYAKANNMSRVNGYDPCVALILHVMRYIGFNGTLLSLTTLATDLYIAIMYPLNYLSLMRKDRVTFIIIVVFLIAFLFGSCKLYLPMLSTSSDHRKIKSYSNYCFQQWGNHINSNFATFGITIVALIVVIVVYSTVFYQIRNFHRNGVCCIHQTVRPARANNNVNNKHIVLRGSSNSSNLKRNQRGLTTIIVLLLAFLCCFLPSFINEICLVFSVSRNRQAHRHHVTMTNILMNLPLLCSALDPLLYSYRLKDIQLSYLRLFCCYRDETKPNLPPLVAGRARPHPAVPVYQPIHRRSIACTSPNSNLKQSLPWSQRLANATGIYIERIRKMSSQSSSVATTSNKRTPVSAPPFNKTMNYETPNEALLAREAIENPCYTVPADISMSSSNFISPPKMVLCTWNFANKSLRQSWLVDDPSANETVQKQSMNLFGRKHKLSSYSSSECGACSAHSGSIDSANTNSTGTAGSYNQNRTHSFDQCRIKTITSKSILKDIPSKITE